MLAFTIATFFALALIGALMVISYMFFEYQDKVKAVFAAELAINSKGKQQAEIRVTHNIYRHPAAKSRQIKTASSIRPASRLRAAA